MAKASEYVPQDYCDERHTNTTRSLIALGTIGGLLLPIILTSLCLSYSALSSTSAADAKIESLKENGQMRDNMLKEIRDDVKQILRNGGHE